MTALLGSAAQRARLGSVAGLLLVGFHGVEPGEWVTDLIRLGCAGVVLFSRNLVHPAQAAELCRRLQELAAQCGRPPLLIAVDQEGGRVCRLGQGATELPSAMALGAVGDERAVYSLARGVGEELGAVGINLNLAPCADVNSEPQNPVIGTRSFGDDPAAVARLVAAAVSGYQDVRVMATAKHFPGHGHTRLDSHRGLPSVSRGVSELEQVELVPFRAAIDAGVAAIMSAHVVLPRLTGALPATLSRPAMTDLLRGKLGFQGLAMTDCLEMAAIVEHFRPGPASAAAVAAGADLVLWSHTASRQLQALEGLAAAAGGQELPWARVRDSLERVERARLEAVLRAPRRGSVGANAAAGQLARQSRELARAAVTVVWDRGGTLPLPAGRKLAILGLGPGLGPVLGPGPGQGASPGGSATSAGLLASELRARGQAVMLREVATAGAAGRGETADARSVRSADGDGAVAWAAAQSASGARLIFLTRDACLCPWQGGLSRAVVGAVPEAVVVATGLPYDAALVPGASCCIATYDGGGGAMWGLAEVLTGRGEACGRLPVRLPGLAGGAPAECGGSERRG